MGKHPKNEGAADQSSAEAMNFRCTRCRQLYACPGKNPPRVCGACLGPYRKHRTNAGAADQSIQGAQGESTQEQP